MPVQTFLNPEIQGDRTKPFEARTFNREGKIEKPRYDARYLETFPTVWAAAYEFQRLIQLYGEGTAIDKALQAEAQRAVEEWVCLFLLHYFGIINAHKFQKSDFQDYDDDLWPALSRTYPYQHREVLTAITILMADDAEKAGEGTVVGAFYPDIFLFPSRGRSSWKDSSVLQPYLQGQFLSWGKCSTELLESEQDRAEFSTHLLSIENAIEDGQYKKALEKFRKAEVKAGHLPSPGDAYPNPLLKRVVVTSAETLMKSYPLVYEVIDKDDPTKVIERTYYLVDGMPHEPRDEWMQKPIGRGLPTPRRYVLKSPDERKVIIKFAGTEIPYELKNGDNDDEMEHVVMLRDCFLSVNPFWCGIPKDSNAFAARIIEKHKVKGDWNQQPFATMSDNEMPVCLAPVNHEFLRHFSAFQMFEDSNPGMLKRVDSVLTKIKNESGEEEAGMDWFFTLKDSRTGVSREIRWTTNIEVAPALSNNTVALWPPQVSEEWNFYVARGYGALKTNGGRWVLVDEHGKFNGKPEELDSTEYISIIPKTEPIANTPVANRPKSLLLLDAEDQERGVLFLSGLQQSNFNSHAQARLAVDFGTSNTCLAYEVANTREPLVFSLAPVMLWGKRPKEMPGFVPSSWPGKKFFPTILLSRKKAAGLDRIGPSAIEARHLFQVDIPVLHKDMEERLYTGAFKEEWMIQDNMKWELRVEHPSWRALFLGLSLLYAHAELFFKHGVKVDDVKGNDGSGGTPAYIFTYPLAFDNTDLKDFRADAKQVTDKIRALCYREASLVKIDSMDESKAIALSKDIAGSLDTLNVFVDVGGGTADIAVRHLNAFPVRDSIKVAGQTFFQFAKENFTGEPKGHDNFKLNLGRLLFKQEQQLSLAGVTEAIDLGTYYSLAIGRLDKKEFESREAVVRQNVERGSYQFYRSLVFFRHLLAYALLQACAAAVNNEDNPDKIHLILAGNAWGLLLFARLERDKDSLKAQATSILKLLQKNLEEALKNDSESSTEKGEDNEWKQFVQRLKSLKIIDVDLLNQNDLETAKTSVAKGALKGDGGGAQTSLARTESYAGLSVGRVKVSQSKEITVNWFDKWTLEAFDGLVKKADEESGLESVSKLAFEHLKDTSKPFDPVLSAFARLANLDLYDSSDQMTEADWSKINAWLRQEHFYYKNGELTRTPINFFVSGVLYPQKEEHTYLRQLAAKNNCL